MSDPVLIGIAIVLVIACIPAGLIALPMIAVIIRVKNLESQTKTALAQIAEFQGNLIDEMPEKHGERLVKVEKWIEGREALARHITAQTQHRRGGEGGLQ